jgi:hypothetical protein
MPTFIMSEQENEFDVGEIPHSAGFGRDTMDL